MNRFFCWLTGGHRYSDQNIKFSSDYKTNEFIFRNYCVKCRKPDVIRISKDVIFRRYLICGERMYGKGG